MEHRAHPVAPHPRRHLRGGPRGPSTVAWSELLHAAGAPLAVELPSDDPVPDGARLVVVASTDGLDALRAPGRAVVAMERAGERRRASAMTWGDITVPLDGAEVVALAPADGETVVATDDAGHPLAALSSRDGSATLRLGVDLAAALWRLRLGDPALPSPTATETASSSPPTRSRGSTPRSPRRPSPTA
ncbi:MAG: hypothetical protein R3A52_18680 [Polyangiales bacterium]